MDGYGPASYGDAMADVYDEWYPDVSDVGTTVQRLFDLAGGGAALELGVGSGRLAIPLALRGVEVWGIDASEAMVERLRSKPGGELVHLTVGDMAELSITLGPGVAVPGFSVVFAACNTLFNLASRDAQVGCLRRAAALLVPWGTLVVEAFVPTEPGDPGDSGDRVSVRSIALDRVVLSVSRHDPDEQMVIGQYVEIGEGRTRLRPWCLRYATPDQLDEMAAEAGLELEQRTGGWGAVPFDGDSPSHVSVYAKPGGGPPLAQQ